MARLGRFTPSPLHTPQHMYVQPGQSFQSTKLNVARHFAPAGTDAYSDRPSILKFGMPKSSRSSDFKDMVIVARHNGAEYRTARPAIAG